jgi:hypothetical protein
MRTPTYREIGVNERAAVFRISIRIKTPFTGVFYIAIITLLRVLELTIKTCKINHSTLILKVISLYGCHIRVLCSSLITIFSSPDFRGLK